MLKTKNKKINIFMTPLLAMLIFLYSCGGSKNEGLAELKTQQATLKTQLAELNSGYASANLLL